MVINHLLNGMILQVLSMYGVFTYAPPQSGKHFSPLKNDGTGRRLPFLVWARSFFQGKTSLLNFQGKFLVDFFMVNGKL